MTEIHATGASEAHYPAERATIIAQVSIASRDRSESISAATKLHNWAAARAQQLQDSGDATWHSAEPISTWARQSYPGGSNAKAVTEHVTNSRVRIKLSNLALVSSVVTELAEAGIETNVTWSLTETFRRECERRGRREAVVQARAVASDYADALGEQIVRVMRISDEARHSGGVQARFAASFDSAGAEVTIAEITVSANVVGIFESE